MERFRWENRIVDFAAEELLDREPVALSNGAEAQWVRNKICMVTGGGGSIGSELCRHSC